MTIGNKLEDFTKEEILDAIENIGESFEEDLVDILTEARGTDVSDKTKFLVEISTSYIPILEDAANLDASDLPTGIRDILYNAFEEIINYQRCNWEIPNEFLVVNVKKDG